MVKIDRIVQREINKLRNLKVKRDNCKEPLGIKRLSGLILDQQKLVDSLRAPG